MVLVMMLLAAPCSWIALVLAAPCSWIVVALLCSETWCSCSCCCPFFGFDLVSFVPLGEGEEEIDGQLADMTKTAATMWH